MGNQNLVIGTGYLGLRVAERWRRQGDTVHVTTRKPETATRLRAAGFLPIVCDVLDPVSLRALPEYPANVLYAVGYDRSAGATLHAVYVAGVRNALTQLKGGRLVFVSSTSVYGQTDGAFVDETSPTEPQEESGRVVLEAEQVVRGVRPDAIVLRFAGMYGPGRYLREAAIRAGTPLAVDPEKWLNLIHIEDGASIVCGAHHRAARGSITNVADGCPVTRRAYYTELARRLGAPPPTFVPAPVEAVNRRIAGGRLRAWAEPLQYPDYRAGLALI